MNKAKRNTPKRKVCEREEPRVIRTQWCKCMVEPKAANRKNPTPSAQWLPRQEGEQGTEEELCTIISAALDEAVNE